MACFPQNHLTRNECGASTKQLGSFQQNERGGITIFVLVLSVLLLVAGGMAVDYQRYELARADLQDALDRGVLAATNINREYDSSGVLTVDEQAEQLISDYMAFRNYKPDGLNLSVTVTPVTGGRQVTASASEPVDPIFLRMVGLTNWDVSVSSGAIQAQTKLEITLVLDVSHSMTETSASGGLKIDQLKVAAKEFLDIVLTADTVDTTLITIVPFSQQVALPRSMADLYNLNRFHDFSSCFDFDSLDFTTTAMPTSPAVWYDQHQHFKERYSSRYPVFPSGTYSCPKSVNTITPFSNDLTALKNAVDTLGTESWTAMYMGMKWGAALLDPSSRPVIDSMIDSGALAENFAGWPHGWNDTTVRKITVLMSDGANTKLHEIHDGESSPTYTDYSVDWWDQNYPPSGYKYEVVDDESTGVGDDHLKSICDRAKIGANSTVYTVGFEVSGNADARAALRDCASSPSTYYLAEGDALLTAFKNIANEIVNLKLVN
jgi:Flp pilus assembly protein TadG